MWGFAFEAFEAMEGAEPVLTDGKLVCYNRECDYNFGDECTKDGVSEARYCRDWRGIDQL